MRDDTVVAGAVREALSRDVQCRCDGIYVESYRGHVQLSGRVDTGDQHQRASAVARAVPGVVDVNNETEVQERHDDPRPRR